MDMDRKTGTNMADKLFALRWGLVLALLGLAVLLKLNGSSLGMWAACVPDGAHPDDGLVLGVDRSVRSDEWAVFTPMSLSQYANDFQWSSSILRGTDTELKEFASTGLVPRLPTFVASCFLALFSLLSLSNGLILQTLGKLARQNFELQLNVLREQEKQNRENDERK